MRTVSAALACLALSSSGCSTLVAVQGIDLMDLKTRAMVHETFGEPAEVRAVGGELREVYSTRRKVADGGNALGYVFLDVVTAGTVEVVLLPYELGKAGYHCIRGQRVEFTYDAADAVTQVSYNGLYPQMRLGSGYGFAEVTPQEFRKSPNDMDRVGAVFGAALPEGQAHDRYLKR